MRETNQGKRIKNLFHFMDIAKRILIFAALVTGTAFLLRPVQLDLQNRMEEIRDSFIGRAEDFLGRKIQYGSMGPSVFGVLDIRDIRILREDDSVLLDVSRLRISYSLFELILGGFRRNGDSADSANREGNFLSAFHSVRVDRPVLSLDFDRDGDLAGLFSAPDAENRGPRPLGPAEETPNFRDLLPENFSLRIWNGEWDLSVAAAGFKLRGFRLDASVRQSRIGFQGRWNAEASIDSSAKALFAADGDASALFEAVMTGRISGEYSADSKEGSAALVIPVLSGDSFRFKPLTVSFFLSGSRLEARKTHDRSPAALSFVYDFENRDFRGNFEGENFSLHDLLTLTGSWKDYEPLLGFRISGSADFENGADGGFLYNLNFSGGLPDNAFSGPGSLAIKAAGDEKHINFEDFSVFSPYGNLDFRGELGFSPVSPRGLLSVSNFNLRKNKLAAAENTGGEESGGISGDFFITTNDREINIFGENISSGTVALSALDANLYREENGLTFALSVLRFRNIESYEDVRTSTVSLEGSLDYGDAEKNAGPDENPDGFSNGEGRNIQASLRLDSFSVGDIIGFVEPLAALPVIPAAARSAAENLSVTTEIFFTTDYEHILYNAPRIVAAYEGLGNILAAASLSGTNERFELSEGRVSWENGNATISTSVDFSDPSDISFSAGTSYKNLTYYLEGMILDSRDISVRGSYGFQAYLGAAENGTYSGYIQGDNIPIPSGDGQASLNFLFSLFYDSPAFWRANIERFELMGLATPSMSFAALRFSGAADESGLNIPRLFFDDGKGALEGDVSLDWDTSYSYCRFGAELSGVNESYSLNGNYRGGGGLELSLSGQGMQFSRVSALNAAADGNFRLSWESPESFEAEAELDSLVLRGPGEELHASVKAGMNADNFTLTQLEMSYSGLDLSVPYLFMDRAAARGETQALVRGSFSGRPVNVSCRARAVFNSTETWLDIFQGINSLDGTLTVDAARFDTIEAGEAFDFNFSCLRERTGLALNLSGGPRNMIRFRYSPESAGGSFYAALSAPSPVRGSVAGSISSKTIDARGTDLYVDLGSLWRFIPPDTSVAFPGGIVTASIRVTGDLEDPEFYGSARGTSVQIRVPEYLPEPIRPVPVTFSLTGNEMTFGPVNALVGNGMGSAAAWFRFDRWIPDTFSIDIQVPQNTPIPYDFDISGVMAHGLASGKLIVGMENRILSINGELTANNTEISINSAEMAALEGEGTFDTDITTFTTVDLSIKAGRRIEFFWPSVEFPILQAYPDMGTGVRITSDEMSRRFTLTGDVRLRGGELFYLTRNFYIREGTLFLNENEVEFDPLISARAEIRDQIESGPVTISLIIDNAPLMSFTPRFESSPPLSQLEIYSLLGQNPQGEEAAEGSQQNIAAAAVADILTQFAVMRRFQRGVRNILGLDMFSVRTQLLQNVVFQAAGAGSREDSAAAANTNPAADTPSTPSTVTASPNSDSNIDKPYRIGNYFDNTTVFIGKYFGADLFGQAMLSFKYDEYKRTYGGLIFEPEIGLEMRNPLFDIQFNMVPLHPENWFIDDVSFSLIWRRSF